MYFIRLKNDRHNRRWKVREAKSLRHAIEEIDHARVTGSVGGRTDLTRVDGSVVVLADVVQVNSDGSERQPYTQAY